MTERDYLNLGKKILKDGLSTLPSQDRTGVGYKYLIGEMLEFDLSNGYFPLLTTKYINFKNVVQELLWFLHGNTNINQTRFNDGDIDTDIVKIWKPWADSAGHIGNLYGKQWRNFGTSCCGKNVDQIKNLIYGLKKEPYSRQHVVSAWNPVEQNINTYMKPCHFAFQFLVTGKNTLDIVVYQRSADFCIGIPYNIASYALLLHMIALECKMSVGCVKFMFGNVHIYSNHIEPFKKQLEHDPTEFPTISIQCPSDIFSIRKEHIILNNYVARDFIKYDVAV